MNNDSQINLQADYWTFNEQVKEKFGNIYASQAEMFFMRAVNLAKKDLEYSAIVDGEFAFQLAQYAKDFLVIYLVGFLCEVHIFTDKIKKAKAYYNLGLQLLDKNSSTYDSDKADFDRLKDLMDGEDWKEKLESDDNE